MKKHIKYLTILFIYLSLMFMFSFMFSCKNSAKENKNNHKNTKELMQEFYSNWEKGNSEITKYDLYQSRYREVRKGHTIMIFVTEPFYTDIQVKSDIPQYKKSNIANVLKLNKIEQFQTGIYDYSIMTSVFTQISNSKDASIANKTESIPQMLKMTNSVQDWCGQTFMQLNRQKDMYEYQHFSYFESEKDAKNMLSADLTEDEIYTMIRISPMLLPIGDIKVMPSGKYARIQHREYKGYPATTDNQSAKKVTNDSFFAKNNINAFSVFYPSLSRKLIIYYNNIQPHTIIGFEEQTLDENNNPIKNLSSIGKKTHSIKTKYWNQNSLKDNRLRKKLGL